MTLETYMRAAQEIARRCYGRTLTDLDCDRLVESYRDDVPVEQAVDELFAAPSED